MSNHWMHAASHAAKSNSKGAGVVLLIIGFFLAPFLIGIPIMILGAIKIYKGY
jgi:hypothetical protein